MNTIDTNSRLVEGYTALLKNMSMANKLDLISKLTESVKTEIAEEKARLRKSGNIIDDFDLLIGATAIAFDLVMVTNNTDHFKRMKKLKLQNWTG